MTENVQNFYAVLLIFVIANALILPLGWLARSHGAAAVLGPAAVPQRGDSDFLGCGAYASINSMFGVVVMTGFGALAWWFARVGIPVAGDPRHGDRAHPRAELPDFDDNCAG